MLNITSASLLSSPRGGYREKMSTTNSKNCSSMRFVRNELNNYEESIIKETNGVFYQENIFWIKPFSKRFDVSIPHR